jgi:lysophospholipase L1-like esterase
MRLKFSVCAALCAVACLLPASALAKTHKPKKKPPTTYYLALGDSLSRGAQPNAAGKTRPTNQGYPNDLFTTEKKTIKGLKLEELGCLGETTTTMMNGGICHYSAGSQLKAALKFIAKHKVALITLDIGANDIDNCVTLSTGAIDTTCVSNGSTMIGTNVPLIAKALRTAAGPKVKIAGMTYYDPFLADYLTGTTGQAEAMLSVTLAQQVNAALSSAYTAQHFKVADVATAFDVYMPFTTTVTVPSLGGPVPVAVAETCALTWMCTAPPVGPNIHATVAGYKEIAKVFLAAL